jgi:hypothetical protein
MFRKTAPVKEADPALLKRLEAIARSPQLDAAVYCDVSNKAQRSPRDPLFKPAAVQLTAGDRFSVVIKNLSREGARLEFFRKHVLTERLYLVEQTLPLAAWARVVWQADGAAGIRFIA